jgi:multiple sugar transport system permease protein
MSKLLADGKQASRQKVGRPVLTRTGQLAVRAMLYGMLIVCALTMLIPVLWTVSTSLKPPGGILSMPPKLLPRPVEWRNYATVFELQPFAMFFVNSIKISSLSTLGMVLSCALGGFTFARLRFRGKGALFSILMVTMMVPGAVTLVPRFILMRTIGWVDTHYALIVPSWTGAAFGVFLMRQYYLSIPQDLVDAGRIDGANFFTIFVRIFLPLGKPVLATLGVLTFMGSWNDLMDPLIMLNSVEKFTVTLGLTFFRGRMTDVAWGPLMAATVMGALPTLLLFVGAQKYFVQGIVTTGLKG